MLDYNYTVQVNEEKAEKQYKITRCASRILCYCNKIFCTKRAAWACKSIAAKVIAAIDKLSQNQRPTGVKKLKGSKDDDFYRIRVTDYRIIYTIEDEVQIIEILKVGHRKEIYH